MVGRKSLRAPILRAPAVLKTASQMHIAPQIAVHIGDNMPQKLSQMCPRCGYQKLPPDGAVIETFDYCSVCSD